MAGTRFEFHGCGIGELLKRGRVQVPPNQRSYAWEERHVRNLLEDLSEAIGNNAEDYFLGTIVVVSDGTADPSIADGQQRTATTTILYGSPEISGHECLLSQAAVAGSSYGADEAGAQPTAQSERIKA